jgi:hypothetical protein
MALAGAALSASPFPKTGRTAYKSRAVRTSLFLLTDLVDVSHSPESLRMALVAVLALQMNTSKKMEPVLSVRDTSESPPTKDSAFRTPVTSIRFLMTMVIVNAVSLASDHRLIEKHASKINAKTDKLSAKMEAAQHAQISQCLLQVLMFAESHASQSNALQTQ